MDLNLRKDQHARRKSTLDLSTMVYGKVPPQAREMEEAVLGAMMIEKDGFDQVASMLRPEMFYVDAHQRIYAAIQALAKKSQPLDILTVSEQLKTTEELEMVGGPYYVTKLTNAVVSAAHIESHCKIIIQKFVQREAIRICGEIIGSAYEDSTDVFDLMQELEKGVDELNGCFHFGSMETIDHVLVKAIQEIEDNRNRGESVTGASTGFTDLNKATRGWQDGNLIILAARPSIGKTALAIRLARNAARGYQDQYEREIEQNKNREAVERVRAIMKRVAFFSLEMKNVKLVLRMLAAEAQELLYRIQTGKLTEPQMKNLYSEGVQKLAQLGISFDDKPGLTVQKLKAKCRKMKRRGELGLVIIDYLQLMTPSNSKAIREQQVSEISRELKLLAEELEVPIIALSQLSRAVETRGAKEGGRVPQLSDLRESGSLEQDADVVMFLYGPSEGEIMQDASLKNRRYLKIAKQRDGFLYTAELDFKDEMQYFQEATNVQELGLPAGGWRPVADVEKPVIFPSSKLSLNSDKMSGDEEDPF